MDEPIIDKLQRTTRGQKTLAIQKKEEYSKGIKSAEGDIIMNSFLLGVSALALITSIIVAATDYKEQFSLFSKIFGITAFGLNTSMYFKRLLESIAKKAKYETLAAGETYETVLTELAKDRDALLSDMPKAELGNVSEATEAKKQGR